MGTKRVVELAEKLAHEENAHLRSCIPQWIEDSEVWAETMVEMNSSSERTPSIEAYRLRYILNHLCPSLYHFHSRRESTAHFRENTQVGIEIHGYLVQQGVVFDAENFDAFCETAKKYL